MPTPKLKDSDFEQIENLQNEHLRYKILNRFGYHYNGKVAEDVKKYVEAPASEAAQKERSAEVKRALAQILTNEASVANLKAAIEEVEPYFEGNRPDASQQTKSLFRNFCYYNGLMLNSWEFFRTYLSNSQNFFSAEIYKQWLAAVKLGIYTAPDYCVLGRSGLNYMDNQSPSPRLEAVKEYYGMICVVRILVEIFDQEIHRWCRGGDSFNIVNNEWTDYLTSCREQLNRNFGTEKGPRLFREIFGSPDPSKPDNAGVMDNIQMKFFTRLAEELLRGGQPEPAPGRSNSGANSFNRDYAGEQAEREAREREERERRGREPRDQEPDWGNLNPQFRNNPPLAQEWTKRGFSYKTTKEWMDIGLKPDQSEYAQFLRDIKKLTPEQVLNEGDMAQIKQEYEEWKKKPQQEKDRETKNNNIDDDEPKPEVPNKDKRDKSPSRQAGEDQAEGIKPESPPTHTEFNSSTLNDALNAMKDELDKDNKEQGHDKPYTPAPGLGMPLNTITKEEAEKLPWLVVAENLQEHLIWEVKDPATAAALQHGSGDYITMVAKLNSFEKFSHSRITRYNFFWAKNQDKKGFERLVKDDGLPDGREAIATEDQLLFVGKREDDKRTNKYGWEEWPMPKNGITQFGVPCVKQKSYRFTRMFRNQKNAYDLDDTCHFIGILRSKKIMSKQAGTVQSIAYGSGPSKSVLWITNQFKYPREKGEDWTGDDIQTINSNNGFSHYLIFSNYSVESIKKKFLPHTTTLAQLVGQLKGTLVRIGPDVLELINSQNEDQKGRSQDETPESRKDTDEAVKPKDLKDLGLTPEEFELLKTAFLDPAHLANLIKKLATANGVKMAQMLDKMFDTIQPKTAENMYQQMVDNNPVFTEKEKEELKTAYKNAKTKEEKKKLWQDITSNQAAEKARQKREQEAKENQQKPPSERQPDPRDKIMEEWIEKNPRYGPPGVDTQERRDRHEEWAKATPEEKEKMFKEESKRFTTGENANQWSNYFQDNANREAGAGDESVGTETDNNFSGQFSFADSLAAINKLKNIGSMKPPGMEEGMKSNKPYWQVVFNHPLTYIFLFIGIIIAIMAAATRKNRN